MPSAADWGQKARMGGGAATRAQDLRTAQDRIFYLQPQFTSGGSAPGRGLGPPANRWWLENRQDGKRSVFAALQRGGQGGQVACAPHTVEGPVAPCGLLKQHPPPGQPCPHPHDPSPGGSWGSRLYSGSEWGTEQTCLQGSHGRGAWRGRESWKPGVSGNRALALAFYP